MIDNTFQETSLSYFGRKILQINSSSTSFDASQPLFIVLISIVAVLTIVFTIIIIILYCRFCTHQKRTLTDSHNDLNTFQRIFHIEKQHTVTAPVSATSATSSSYSIKTYGHTIYPSHTLPSRHIQQTTIDAYLNDVNLFSPESINVRKLNPYLFIDLHSTSSETYPDNVMKQFTNNISTRNEIQRKYYQQNYYFIQKPGQLTSTINRSYGSRFLMRERYLSDKHLRLPQLRQTTMQRQKHLFGIDDSSNSDQTLQSTSIFSTSDGYQNQILESIKEERLSTSHYPYHYHEEPYYFEITSTSPGDDSDNYKSSPIKTNSIAYINDSIIV